MIFVKTWKQKLILRMSAIINRSYANDVIEEEQILPGKTNIDLKTYLK